MKLQIQKKQHRAFRLTTTVIAVWTVDLKMLIPTLKSVLTARAPRLTSCSASPDTLWVRQVAGTAPSFLNSRTELFTNNSNDTRIAI